jgi:HlyD family secretion protein
MNRKCTLKNTNKRQRLSLDKDADTDRIHITSARFRYMTETRSLVNRLIISTCIVVFTCHCSNKSDTSVQTCKTKNGTFNIEVVETGELGAVQATTISSPAMSWRYGVQKIIKIVEDGKEVKKGDTVLILDPTEVHNTIKNAKGDMDIAQTELQKTLDEQDLKIEELKADLQTAKISHEISKIEFEQASYESEIKKKEIMLSLEKARLDLEKASQVIDNTKKINVEDINQANLKIKQYQNNIDDAETTLKTLVVISPANGIAILRKNWNSGNNWQVGDQIWSGMPLIDLPDLKQLKAIADVSEVDISKIRVDQQATIKLDAFPDSIYKGKVYNIATLAKIKNDKNQRIKVFPVEVYINGSSKILMPGMTVSLKVIVNKLDHVLSIPLEALFKKDGKDFVYVKKAASFEKRPVTTGLSNNDFIIIASGIKEGEELALSDPFVKPEKNTKKKKQKP